MNWFRKASMSRVNPIWTWLVSEEPRAGKRYASVCKPTKMRTRRSAFISRLQCLLPSGLWKRTLNTHSVYRYVEHTQEAFSNFSSENFNENQISRNVWRYAAPLCSRKTWSRKKLVPSPFCSRKNWILHINTYYIVGVVLVLDYPTKLPARKSNYPKLPDTRVS